MALTRANIVQYIAADIEYRNQHPPMVSNLGHSGYKCLVCGKFVQVLTNRHAREHGYINKEAMIQAGAVKQYRWGKEVR